VAFDLWQQPSLPAYVSKVILVTFITYHHHHHYFMEALWICARDCKKNTPMVNPAVGKRTGHQCLCPGKGEKCYFAHE
jgi:hypothetical protein